MLGSSRLAAQLAAPQEVLSSMSEWVTVKGITSYAVQNLTEFSEKCTASILRAEDIVGKKQNIRRIL
jgi:hypothetical protein